MNIHAYVFYGGKCREAFGFYERVLGGKITTLVNYGDMPGTDQIPADRQGWVMHARLDVPGGAVLMGSDDCMCEVHDAPTGFKVSLNLDDPAEAERAFCGLAEGGTITMPIVETAWSLNFGMLTDRYGIPWMVNCPKPM